MNSAREGLPGQQNVKRFDWRPLTLAEGESPPSQILCGKPASVPAVKNGQFVKRFTRY
jgi:hypothetical protein